MLKTWISINSDQYNNYFRDTYCYHCAACYVRQLSKCITLKITIIVAILISLVIQLDISLCQL